MPAGFGDGDDTSPCLDRIKKVGHVFSQIMSESQTFSARFFPDENSDPVDFSSVPQLLSQGVAELDRQNRSATRDASRISLALAKAWYSDIDVCLLIEYFPTEDEVGNPIAREDVLREVQGYATRVDNRPEESRVGKEC